MKILLKFPNIDVNKSNRRGETARIMASAYGYLEFVKTLLGNAKVDIHQKNKRDQTARDMAYVYVSNNEEDIIIHTIDNYHLSVRKNASDILLKVCNSSVPVVVVDKIIEFL